MPYINKWNVKNRILIIFSLVAAIFIVGDNVYSSSHESMKDETNEAAIAIKDYTIEQKEKAVANAEELIEKFDNNMHVWEGRMKEKWDDLKNSSKDNYEASKKSLGEQRKELSVWLDKMQNSSADAWDEIKAGFVGAYDSMKDSWVKVQKEVEDEI